MIIGNLTTIVPDRDKAPDYVIQPVDYRGESDIFEAVKNNDRAASRREFNRLNCYEHVLYGYTNQWTVGTLLEHYGLKDIRKFDRHRRLFLQEVIGEAERATARAEIAKRTLKEMAALNPPETFQE